MNPAYDLNIAHYSSRNLLEAPVNLRDDCYERKWEAHLGEQAFVAFAQAHPEKTYSEHYARGFVDGFVDYLYAGGTGDPPVAPPWRYQKATFETPEGYAAIDDWFAGFRAGAGEAKASGLRKQVVVPLALAGPINPIPGLNLQPSTPPAPAPARDPVLPPPRTLPPSEEKMPPANKQ
jgi:hypothetical protein